MLDFPNNPTLHEAHEGPSGQIWVWDGEKWRFGGGGVSIDLVPVVFFYSSKPAANGAILVPLTIPLVLAANFPGTQWKARLAATANADFQLFHTTNLGDTLLGTITVPPAGPAILSGAGATLLPGHALTMRAPATQDDTLEDIGISVLTTRA